MESGHQIETSNTAYFRHAYDCEHTDMRRLYEQAKIDQWERGDGHRLGAAARRRRRTDRRRSRRHSRHEILGPPVPPTSGSSLTAMSSGGASRP